MAETLQPILALLDEGLSLYRRNFGAFVVIAASWFVPVAIAVGLAVAAGSWLDGGWGLLLLLLFALLLFPLLIYLIGGLSRAAGAAADGRPVRYREAMAIHPLRAVGMGCFTIVYYIVAQIGSSAVSMICICPMYLVGLVAVGGLANVTSGSSAIAVLGLVVVGIVFTGVYIFVLIVGGATYSSIIYGLQPWVQETRPFGESVQRSIELITYRFRRNLLAWGLAALLVAAVGLTVTLAIGVILPLPLSYLLGAESPVAQALSVSAWLIGLVVVLPPLPIWMALLYRRNSAARDGADLDTKVQDWWRGHFGEPESRSQPAIAPESQLPTPNPQPPTP